MQIVSIGVLMDRLSAIFSRFMPAARVFYSGSQCRRAAFDCAGGVGHVHILKSGSMLLRHGDTTPEIIDQPSVLFYPRPRFHEFESAGDVPMELLCASIDLGESAGSPLGEALPDFIVVPFSHFERFDVLTGVLFSEAFEDHCGRQVALDHLVSYFLVLLLRYLIDAGVYKIGVFAGLSDAKLSKALTMVHDSPERNWTLESLADAAGMSRARFAAYFRATVGTTPMDYVAQWRMSVAKSLLKQGYSVKQVAPKVGYQSAAAMSRTFNQRLGLPPSEWLSLCRGNEPAALHRVGLHNYRPA